MILKDPKPTIWVIWGTIEGQRLQEVQSTWRRIRESAGLSDVRIHDLRHSFASSAVEMGQSLPMIGKLLGHTQVQTTARYAHLAADPVITAATQVSNNIYGFLEG
ncbi:MAG: tyrosine-type recombinase/integrase [Alphaproteobacteria bacterium]